MTSPLISTEELNEDGLDNLVILDARSGPMDKQKYDTEHLVGAVWVDLEHDLADVPKDASSGGRHPLPDVKEFAAFLGKCGINPETKVVVYDDQGGANAAARCWWMLKAIGHTNVQVLDGGYQEAVRIGLPLTSEISKPIECDPYPANDWHLPSVKMDQIQGKLKDGFKMIDVRSQERYLGESEPIDLIAGHIPYAENIPLTENLRDGKFKSKKDLESLYAEYDPDKLIVHCGSGVTACHSLLAFAKMGKPIPSLYVGSWSEWSRNGNEMVLKKEG